MNTALCEYLAEVQHDRQHEADIIEHHLELSLNELIKKNNLKLTEYIEAQQRGESNPFLASNIAQTENRILELTNRLELRKAEIAKERICTIASTEHIGSAWILPHPERQTPEIKPMTSDADIERIAVQEAIKHEEALGYAVQSVEKENRGFDLISRKMHPEDIQTAIDVKFIEVKGRATIGNIALSANEFKTAERLKKDYWLYVVFNCSSKPEINIVRDPARLEWKSIVRVEQYLASPNSIRGAKQTD